MQVTAASHVLQLKGDGTKSKSVTTNSFTPMLPFLRTVSSRNITGLECYCRHTGHTCCSNRRQQLRPAPVHATSESSSCDAVLLPVDTLDPFPSHLAPQRRVDIMLPPGYNSSLTTRYPVLYMHDGQNAIDPATSFIGVDWGLDEALVAGVESGHLREFISVLVWNTPQRLQEYMPAQALRWLTTQEQCWYDRVEDRYYNPTSDAYLAMLVHEVKPWVDAHYRILPGRQHTSLMGSSMGGLVSLYALQRYPEVFGAAACLSTHWAPGGGLPVAWLAQGNIPNPATHRLYFDHGSKGLDAEYGAYQKQVDQLCTTAGYTEGVNYHSMVFAGETHNELAWRKRLHLPLQFLYGAERCSDEQAG